MGLKKFCRCGSVIEYTVKYCDKCQEEATRVKKHIYNKYEKTNRSNHAKYNGVRWQSLRDLVKVRCGGICKLSLLINKKMINGDLVHHIIPVIERDELFYKESNLIYVSDYYHKLIHKTYDDNNSKKEALIEQLSKLVNIKVEDLICNDKEINELRCEMKRVLGLEWID